MADLALPKVSRLPSLKEAAGHGWRVGTWRMMLGVVLIILLLVTPIPPILIDLLLAISLTSAVLILMTTLLMKRPLDFTSFPTVLWSPPCSGSASTWPPPA